MGMVCANCGRELVEHRCKVRCPACGYFEDCSDPSAPGEWGAPPAGGAADEGRSGGTAAGGLAAGMAAAGMAAAGGLAAGGSRAGGGLPR
jgi:hypothetical protein